MKTIDDLINLVQAWIDVQAWEDARDANRCEECAFWDREEWEMPCTKCRRNCKDYWRRKAE